MIYFVQAGENGPIKIGRASDPRDRLSELQVSHPETLMLLAVAAGGSKEEREYHSRFAAAHIRGEWFHPADDLMAFIRKDGIDLGLVKKKDYRKLAVVQSFHERAAAAAAGILWDPPRRKPYGKRRFTMRTPR